MSYIFDFNKASGLGTTASASGVAPLTDKKEDKLSPAKIMIFTPRGDKHLGRSATELNKKCAASEVSFMHHAVDGPQLVSAITRLRAKGMIGNDTQIILSMHGAIHENSDGHLDLALGHADAEEKDTGSALAILGAIRKPLDGGSGPCSATVYISACGAGAQDFVNRVQKLHNDYKAGVCFLLSSKEDVSDAESRLAISTICDQFIAGNDSEARSPTPDHIFALITAQAGDCMSMVVANEAHPRRVHTPKAQKDAGAEALIRRLDNDALIFSEKGKSHGLIGARQGDFQEDPQRCKGTISGDYTAMEDYRKALLGLSADDKKIEKTQQYLRIARKLALQSDCRTLENYLTTSTDFAGLERREWGASHEDVVELLGVVIKDGDDDRAKQKLLHLASRIQEAYQQASDDARSSIMRKILRKDSECFYALNKTGFFIRREGTTEERIAPVAIILAHHSDLARLKELMDLRPDGSSNETVADIWTNNLKQGEPIAIGLSLQLIDAAGDNRQRKSKTQIIGYAIDALRTSQCEAFLKERSFKIVSEHPGAFGVLTLAGLI